MTQPKTRGPAPSRRGRQTGFTFVEVLAALVFMAIVIPTVIQGLLIANRAAISAQRKRVAIRLADNLLNQLSLSNQWQFSEASGNFGEAYPGYQWQLQTDAWPEDTMRSLRVEVLYRVQGQPVNLSLTTLVPEPTQ